MRDNGIGISAEMLPRIFEMFSQATPALERSQGGLGIGLSLVKGLVELAGGHIEANSAGPGRGSEFLVRLPIIIDSRPIEPVPHAPLDESHRFVKRRLLIVDDLKDSAESLARLMRLKGVETAYDGEQAVQAAESFRPDVVLLDIGMPKLNGYDTCRRIRQQPWGKSIFLVALTGWGQESDRLRTQEAGFDQHLVKPIEPNRLARLLSTLQEAE